MEWVETTARTVEAAKERALDRLGVEEKDAEILVLYEPRGGLLGRLARREARVRARVRPAIPVPKRQHSRVSRKDGREKARQAGRGSSAAGTAKAPRDGRAADAPPKGQTEEAGQGKRRNTHATTTKRGAASTRPDSTAKGKSGPTAKEKRPRTDGGQGVARKPRGEAKSRGADRPQELEEVRAADRADDGGLERGQAYEVRSARKVKKGAGGEIRGDEDRVEARRDPVVNETMSLRGQGEEARHFVEGLIRELGFSASTTTREIDEDTLEVSVEGEGLGTLVGSRGSTLGAIQEITRTAPKARATGSWLMLPDTGRSGGKPSSVSAERSQKRSGPVVNHAHWRPCPPLIEK
jgi:predicted RNA-binding protein Jag